MPARSQPQPARQGPRPLPFHLATALLLWNSSLVALPFARQGLLPWKSELAEEARRLADELAAAAPDALQVALEREVVHRLECMLAGIEAYRRHPYRRRLREPPVVWQEGSTRLIDYAARRRAAPVRMPVLFVPSLINRPYVLDLSLRLSLLRYLTRRGFRPLLVDWGAPSPEERAFTLTDYIAGRLEAALAAAVKAAGGRVAVVGYCMGGLLALALALRRPREVNALALLATPWDFHADGRVHAQLLAAAETPLKALLRRTGELPVEVLQAMLTWFHPHLVPAKFAAFARLNPEGERAEDFVALEDWVNDGVPLAAPVAEECLVGWYGRNLPAKGAWRVAGAVVRPQDLRLPALIVVPKRDRLVPPASAAMLAALVDGATTLVAPGGHVGMVVGRGAREGLWRPLAAWLKRVT